MRSGEKGLIQKIANRLDNQFLSLSNKIRINNYPGKGNELPTKSNIWMERFALCMAFLLKKLKIPKVSKSLEVLLRENVRNTSK